MIEAVKRLPGYEHRIEKRMGHEFLCIRDTELGCGLGADLIKRENVDAVRALLDGGAS